MLLKGMMLASANFYGGEFGNILAQWEQMGVFSYVLPFLLIFSLIYGILNKVNLFGDDKSKAINAIIALSTALMSLQFGMVSIFFQKLFPQLGIVISIILLILIVMGLFVGPANKVVSKIFLWGSLAMVVFIALNSLGIFDFTSGGFFDFIPQGWGPLIVLAIVVLVVVGSATKSTEENTNTLLSQALSATSPAKPA